MENLIELTELELKMLKLDLKGRFYPMTATDEEFAALNSVIEKAQKLMEELNAYDELGSSLMKWFFKKYQEQQK